MHHLILPLTRILGLSTAANAGIFGGRSKSEEPKVNMSPVTYGSYIQFKSNIKQIGCTLQASNAFEINLQGTANSRRFMFCSTPDTSPGDSEGYTFDAAFTIAPVIEGIDFLRPSANIDDLPKNTKTTGQVVNCGDEFMLVRNGDGVSEFVARDFSTSLLTESPAASSMTWREFKDELKPERARLTLKCVNKKIGDVWKLNDEISLVSNEGEYLSVIYGSGRGRSPAGQFHRGNCPNCPHLGSFDVAFLKDYSWPLPKHVYTAKAVSYVEPTDAKEDKAAENDEL